VDERLRRRDHQHVVGGAVGGELEGDARPTDAGEADEHLDEVVEHGGRVVLDGARAHDELVARIAVHPEEPEVAQVFDPGRVEVRQVAAVVDDALGVGVGEADARERGELERRPAVRARAGVLVDHGCDARSRLVSPGTMSA
jgi:hypothetical protein